jgi:hypothetical protein
VRKHSILAKGDAEEDVEAIGHHRRHHSTEALIQLVLSMALKATAAGIRALLRNMKLLEEPTDRPVTGL